MAAPFSTLTVALTPRTPLLRGQPWAYPVTWRNPPAPGQPAASGPPIDLTGATTSCTVQWAGGTLTCAMPTPDTTGNATPSLTPEQTDQITAELATAHLNITDTAGNSFNFQIGLEVCGP